MDIELADLPTKAKKTISGVPVEKPIKGSKKKDNASKREEPYDIYRHAHYQEEEEKEKRNGDGLVNKIQKMLNKGSAQAKEQFVAEEEKHHLVEKPNRKRKK